MRWEEVFFFNLRTERRIRPGPSAVVDRRAARQPRRPPTERARRHYNVVASRQHRQVDRCAVDVLHLSAAAVRDAHLSADSARYFRNGHVAACPVDLVRADNEVNTRITVDKVAHRSPKVVLVGDRVSVRDVRRAADVVAAADVNADEFRWSRPRISGRLCRVRSSTEISPYARTIGGVRHAVVELEVVEQFATWEGGEVAPRLVKSVKHHVAIG